MGRGLHKSKSNFTLRRLHQSGNYGNIYERDILTIVNGGFAPEGQIPINNSPSFKLSVRAGYNGRKIHNYGEWLTNSTCPNNLIWTIGCMPEPAKDDTKINLKPKTSRLSDFVCYSSSSELIRASLDYIIRYFPAEIYTNSDKIINSDLNWFNDVTLRESDLYHFVNKGVNYYLVKNPFNIDLTRLSVPDNNNSSLLRYFCKSFNKYQIIDAFENVYDVEKWYIIEPESGAEVDCLTNGLYLGTVILEYSAFDEYEKAEQRVVELNAFYFNNDILFLTKDINELESLFPIINGNELPREKYNDSQYIIFNNEYYEWIDDEYQKIIIPIYHIRPNEECINSFFNNLDDFQKVILNRNTRYRSKFDTYIEDDEKGWYLEERRYQWPIDSGGWNILVDGVEYMRFVDSLSELALGYDENVTDAIWRTMTHESISNMDLTITRNNEEEYVNSSKMKKVLNIIGRQFDDIKRYIDNIKYSNNISYTQENNTPDYFLSDWLELSGWETTRLFNGVSESNVTLPMYGSRTIGFTASDANNEFLRRLKLNSRNIFSKKGTKQCIEDLMAVFGFHSINWLERYYGVLPVNSELYAKSFEIKEYNYKIAEYTANTYTIDEIKIKNSEKLSYDDGAESNTNVNPYQGLPITDILLNGKHYIIPWFDKNETYDGKVYFQSKGGWMKDVKYSNSETPVYDYTNSNIYAYGTKEEVFESFKKQGHYFYIQNEDKCYTYDEDEKEFVLYPTVNTIKLNKVPLKEQSSYKYIIVNDEYYRWNNRPSDVNNENTIEIYKEEDLKNIDLHNKGIKYVKYLDEYYQWGNNKYELFAAYIKLDSKPTNSYTEAGKLEDLMNEYVDYNKGNNPHSGVYDNGDTYINAYKNWFGNSEFDSWITKPENSGFTTSFNIDRSNKCAIIKDTEEGLLDSLYTLNTKHFFIIFDERHEDFIRNNILPYLKQVIPSTTIIQYDFARLGIARNIEFTIEGIQDDTNTNLFQINPSFDEDEVNTLIIASEPLPENYKTDYVLMDTVYFKWNEHYVLEEINKTKSVIAEVDTVPLTKYYLPSSANNENTIIKTYFAPTLKEEGYDFVKHNDVYYHWIEDENGNGEYQVVNNNLITPDYILCKGRYFKWYERYEVIDNYIPKDATENNTLIIDGNILPSEEKNGYIYIKMNDIYYKWVNGKYIKCEIPINDVTILSGYNLPTQKYEGYSYIIFKGEYYKWEEGEGYKKMDETPTIAIVKEENLPTQKYDNSKFILFKNEYYEWVDGEYIKIIAIIKDGKLPTQKYDESKYILFEGDYYEWKNNKYQKIDTKPIGSTIDLI